MKISGVILFAGLALVCSPSSFSKEGKMSTMASPSSDINYGLMVLYVKDQTTSSRFYRQVLNREPDFEVPGMTQFNLGNGFLLGLMPEAGIKRLLGEALPDPAQANGIPRAELYINVTNPEDYHRRALQAGARELSPLLPRSWGEKAAYSIDPDGHVLGFGGKLDPK